MTVAANSRVTCRAANDTRFIVGEAETHGKVNPQGSDDVQSQRGTSSSQLTVLSLLLSAHLKVEVSFETAWYPSAQKHHARVADGGASATRIHANADPCQSVRAEHLRTRRMDSLCLADKFTRRTATQGSG